MTKISDGLSAGDPMEAAKHRTHPKKKNPNTERWGGGEMFGTLPRSFVNADCVRDES